MTTRQTIGGISQGLRLFAAATAAGPSRLPFHHRALHLSASRGSAPKGLPAALQGPKSSRAGTSKPAATSHHAAAVLAKSTPLGKTSLNTSPPAALASGKQLPGWPWRTIPSLEPGVIEEERVIFARPFEGPFGSRVKLLWIAIPFYGFAVIFWLTTPKIEKRMDADGEEEIVAVMEEGKQETFFSVLGQYGKMFIIFTTPLACFIALASPTRLITRLSLVRQRPIGSSEGSAGTKRFIRMTHGGHLMMWGKYAGPRDLALDQISVRMIKRKSPYLNVKVDAPHKTRFNLDAWPYRLDFRELRSAQTPEQEVVLSLQRIEQVFGRV